MNTTYNHSGIVIKTYHHSRFWMRLIIMPYISWLIITFYKIRIPYVEREKLSPKKILPAEKFSKFVELSFANGTQVFFRESKPFARNNLINFFKHRFLHSICKYSENINVISLYHNVLLVLIINIFNTHFICIDVYYNYEHTLTLILTLINILP